MRLTTSLLSGGRPPLFPIGVMAGVVGCFVWLGHCASAVVAQERDPSSAVIASRFIYESAPFPECHASTIVSTPSGLVAAWFGGQHEKAPDVGIWVARYDGKGEGGQGWSAPVEVANGVQHTKLRWPCWNPVLFQDPEGPLVLFYKVGPSPSTWWGMRTESVDGGITWSRPHRLPDGILGPIKNKPVRLKSGDWLCPTSYETDEKPSRWTVHFERTGDRGFTWSRTEPLNDGLELAAIQPSILTHADGGLQALGRTRQGRLFTIRSADQGETWGKMGLLDLPNSNSGTDAVTLRDGRHVLVYNHTSKGRSPLNVAVSRDGENWEGAVVLESEPGEYSYPAVIEAADGRVEITYTWKRQRIKHVTIDPSRLVTRPIVEGRWPD
jgi:predicted neuraminidase